MLDEQAWADAINSPTKRFPENETQGLIICGANWGGDPKLELSPSDDPRSYFSDARVNNYPYRNRLVTWLALLGHPLSDSAPGPYERAIIQTNWLSGDHYQSKNISGNLRTLCANPEMVSDVVRRFRLLRPRLIVFASAGVFDAFTHVASEFADPLGSQTSETETLWWTPAEPGKRRARAMLLHFEFCNVIGLPHPTGQRAVPNAAIEHFRELIGPVIGEFRAGLPVSPCL